MAVSLEARSATGLLLSQSTWVMDRVVVFETREREEGANSHALPTTASEKYCNEVPCSLAGPTTPKHGLLKNMA